MKKNLCNFVINFIDFHILIGILLKKTPSGEETNMVEIFYLPWENINHLLTIYNLGITINLFDNSMKKLLL